MKQPDERRVTDQVDVGFFSGHTVTSQHTGRHVRAHIGMAPVMNVIKRWPRACVWALGALVAAALASAGVVSAVIGSGGSTGAPACEVTIGAHRYTLDRVQMSNALVITAAASELGMAHHAVTVVIVAGLQESGLHNVDHGDRELDRHLPTAPLPGMGDTERASATGLCRPRLPLAVGADRRLGEPSGHRCSATSPEERHPECIRELGGRGPHDRGRRPPARSPAHCTAPPRDARAGCRGDLAVRQGGESCQPV